jgi:hypothetical protein
MCTAYANYCRNGSVPEPELGFDVGKAWADLGTDIPMVIKNRSWRRPGYDKDTFFCVLNRKDPLPFIAGIALAPLIKLGI